MKYYVLKFEQTTNYIGKAFGPFSSYSTAQDFRDLNKYLGKKDFTHCYYNIVKEVEEED